MKILYIYRHPDMGFSIGKVFKTIENEVKRKFEVDSFYLPVPNYSINGLIKNIQAAKSAVKTKDYDIIHITGTEHYLIPFLPSKKTIVTVHDIGSILNSEHGIAGRIKHLLFVKTIGLSNNVTFISNKSKEETEQYVDLSKSNVKIIYNPIDASFSYSEKELNVKKPIILHVGTKLNKNLERTILALNGLSCQLRIIGKLNSELEEKLKENHIEYSNVYNISDQELLSEYVSCDIVNFPSIYEGFGMPIIEGQAIGRVVVTSKLAPMTEVANGSAVMVNPYDIKSIRAGYSEAINNSKKYIELGKENVRRFTVNSIANEYASLYTSML